MLVSLAIHTVAVVWLVVTATTPASHELSTLPIAVISTNTVDEPDFEALPEDAPFVDIESVPPIEDLSPTDSPWDAEDLEEPPPEPSFRAPFTPLDVPRTAFRRHRAPAPSAPEEPPPTSPPVRRTVVAAHRAPSRPAPSAPLRVLTVPSLNDYYPPVALQQGLQGTVIVVLWIDADGLVRRVTVERSSGHDTLDDAARALATAYLFSSGAGWRRTRLPVVFQIPAPGG